MKLNQLTPIPLPDHVDLPEDVIIHDKALEEISRICDTHLGRRYLILADPETWSAVNHHDEVQSRLTAHSQLHLLHSNPKGDTEAIKAIRSSVEGFDGILAVGSGTINDMGKSLAAQCNKPYVILGTAASMNGFASSIAALMENNLKVTVPAVVPRAIVMDTRVLVDAPLAMSQAGFGDLVSKPVSMADWWVRSRLEDSFYNDLPDRIVAHAIESLLSQVEGIPKREEPAFATLARALVLSGVSMAVAGSSAPASGGEHLISHLWDMEAIQKKQEIRLHGAQVGIATCLSAALYEKLLDLDHPSFPAIPDWEKEAKRIQHDHGALADCVLPEARAKHAGMEARVSRLRETWPQFREQILALGIPSPNSIHRQLNRAKAPNTLADLRIDLEDAHRALRIARDIRQRHTVLDLAYELGFFPDGIDEVIGASGV